MALPAPAAVGAAGSDNFPTVVQVVGRAPPRENSDVFGEYVYSGAFGGRPVYRQRGTSAVIRYAPASRRWIIDRRGLRDSDVCVAYADDRCGVWHPARIELIWHVWEASAQAHVRDAAVAVLDAPAVLSLVGRVVGGILCAGGASSSQFDLSGLHHGRATYRQRGGDTVLRFHSGRWLLSPAGGVSNLCFAYAEGAAAEHPACGNMVWNVLNAQRQEFFPDPTVIVLSCPTVVHVIGRAETDQNSRINGTYQLVAARDGRPVYLQLGTTKVIRYSAKSQRWLIDCDGPSEPSLIGRVYHWLSGDASEANERCCAYADAHGALHPGSLALEWRVWDLRVQRHVFDEAVRSTTAPLAIQVCGRSPNQENSDICGEYFLAGTHNGRPAYWMSGTRLLIRFWSNVSKWVIDREGMPNTDRVVAFAEELSDAEYPSQAGRWHVFESSRGCHLPDPNVTVVVPPNAPTILHSAAVLAGPGAGAAFARKRPVDGLGGEDGKRMCFDHSAIGGGRYATFGA